MRYLETHLIEKLKEKIYTSFEDLNADIKKIVAVLNARPFQNQAFSRQEMFIKYDKPCMKPLPGGEYTTCDYKAVLKVPNNYHIDYDGSKVDAKKAVEAFVDTVSNELKEGGKVALLGFGSFSVSEKAARKGVNPKTKETIEIAARKAVKFKAGAELNELIK